MLAPYASAGRLDRPATITSRSPPRLDGDRVRSVTVRDLNTGDRPGPRRPLHPRRHRAGRPPADWPASSTSSASRPPPRPATASPPIIPSRSTSRPSPSASPSSTAPARTTRSTSRPSTPSGAITCPTLSPPWPGPLLSLTYSATRPRSNPGPSPSTRPPTPSAGGPTDGSLDPRQLPPRRPFDGSDGVTLVNWPQNDYLLGPPVGVPADEAGRPPPPGQADSACPSSTGSRPNAPAPTAASAGRGSASGPTSSARTTAWRRPLTSASPAGFGPSSPSLEAPRRHRGPPPRHRPRRPRGRPLPRLRRRRQLPDRPPPEHRRQQLHRHQFAPLPDPARRPDPGPRREPAPRLQEPRHDPRHQRLLPPPPRRVGHRRGRRLPRRLLPRPRPLPRAVRNTPAHLRDFQSLLDARGVERSWPRPGPR